MLHVLTGYGSAERRPGLVHQRPVSDRLLRLFAVACWRTTFTPAPPEEWTAALCELEELAEGRRRDFSHRLTGYICATVDVPDLLRCVAGLWLGGDHSPEERARNAATAAALLRDVVGNPFRAWMREDAFAAGAVIPGPKLGIVWQKWLTTQVLSLAGAAYALRCRGCERCYDGWLPGEVIRPCPNVTDGTLDPARLAVLSDALEEAGCTDAHILRHLRGEFLMPPEQCYYCNGSGIDHKKLDQPHVSYMVPPRCQHCSGGKAANTGGWKKLPGPCVRGCHVLDLILGRS